jgi:hypothetical protein
MHRRHLRFLDFAEVTKEANRLLTHPYEKTGTWDLAQVCNHLADAMNLSITTGATPMVSLPVRWYLRWRYLQRVLDSRRLPSSAKAPPEVASPPSGDAAPAVQRLHDAVAKINSHTGEFTPHPYFGYLKPPQARQFHLIHCAHHLGFLVPTA